MMYSAVLAAALPALLLAADTCTDPEKNVECTNCDFMADLDLVNQEARKFRMMSATDWKCSSNRCGVGLSGNGPWGGLTTPDGNP
jgi:hypothetical protein